MSRADNSDTLHLFVHSNGSNMVLGLSPHFAVGVVDVNPSTRPGRLCHGRSRMIVPVWENDLYLGLLRTFASRYVVPEISAVDLAAHVSKGFKVSLVALPSGLSIDSPPLHTSWHRKGHTNKPKQIAPGPESCQHPRVRTSFFNPCWQQASHASTKLNGTSDHPKILHTLRWKLSDRDLIQPCNQRIKVARAMMLEVLPHAGIFKLGLNEAVGQQPYRLSCLVSLNPHQFKQALLLSFSCSFVVQDWEVASGAYRDNRANSLDPVRCVSPFALNAPCPSNHADQSNKRDCKGQENRPLSEHFSPSRRLSHFPSRFRHVRTPGLRLVVADECNGVAA